MSHTPPIDLADIYAMIDAGELTIAVEWEVGGKGAEPPRDVLEAVIAHKPLILARMAREWAWRELSTWRWGGSEIDDPDAPGLDVKPSKAY